MVFVEFFVASVLGLLALKNRLVGIFRSPPAIKFPARGYYGRGDEKEDDPNVYEFQIKVPEEELQRILSRVRDAAIGHEQLEDVEGMEYGFNLNALRQIRDYWLNHYDWRKHEAELNAFPNFRTQIEGLQIHFLHCPAAAGYAQVVPMLICHGWPGNVYEFYKIIPMLTDPRAHGIRSDVAFEVVAPSIPGYGWSEQPQKRGFSAAETARIFHRLMTERLGINKYLAQGGDWGAAVTTNLAKLYPESLYGLHLNAMLVKWFHPSILFKLFVGSYFPKTMFTGTAYNNYSLKKSFFDLMRETGYFHIQATKPDTIGVALNDSPLGLLAYIAEKFRTWTSPDENKGTAAEDGGIQKSFTLDEIITIVMIYAVNGNILSAVRYYRENIYSEEVQKLGKHWVTVPTGYAFFPRDILNAPKEVAQDMYNIVHYTAMSGGGHFAAFEKPQELATDIFDFQSKLYPRSSKL